MSKCQNVNISTFQNTSFFKLHLFLRFQKFFEFFQGSNTCVFMFMFVFRSCLFFVHVCLFMFVFCFRIHVCVVLFSCLLVFVFMFVCLFFFCSYLNQALVDIVAIDHYIKQPKDPKF